MICITNAPGENDGYRKNPESSPCIYTTSVMDTQFHIVTNKRIKKYEVKSNPVQVNSVEKSARVTKQGRSFENILSKLENIRSYTNNMEEPTEYFLQVIITLSTYTLKDTFFHLGGY